MSSTITATAVSPTTSKGDLEINNGSGVARLAVGTNDQVLTADSTAPNGVAWKDAGGELISLMY